LNLKSVVLKWGLLTAVVKLMRIMCTIFLSVSMGCTCSLCDSSFSIVVALLIHLTLCRAAL
jgi:hypothetical protein